MRGPLAGTESRATDRARFRPARDRIVGMVLWRHKRQPKPSTRRKFRNTIFERTVIFFLFPPVRDQRKIRKFQSPVQKYKYILYKDICNVECEKNDALLVFFLSNFK